MLQSCSNCSLAVASSVLNRFWRACNSSKSTRCPSKSGPSTQANFTSLPTVTRHEPHMPVPSTMIVLSETIVLTPNGRVVSTQECIIRSGPIAMTMSGLSASGAA